MFFPIAGLGALCFGGLLFFAPALAAQMLGIAPGSATFSVIHVMGGLSIGTGVMTRLVQRLQDTAALRVILITNIVTHAFCLAADIWGIADGALTVAKILPVEVTHLFVGIGSCICLLRLPKA